MSELKEPLTSLISARESDPFKSCLFANINSVAPANLCRNGTGKRSLYVDERDQTSLTSSCSKPLSSSLQSFILSLSDESTTQTTASVDSK